MNIFVLDTDPRVAAQLHCDRHVVKMITETCQLLSTALFERGCAFTDIYQPTHINHPCSVWVREVRANYMWTLGLLRALIAEYDHRWPGGEDTKFVRARQLVGIFAMADGHMPTGSCRTPFALAMPNDCKVEGDAVTSYRRYYVREKAHLLKWTNREVPEWASHAVPA